MSYRFYKMVARIISICMVLCVCGNSSYTWAQDAEKVAQVVITGNQNINMETIRGVVSLKAGDAYSSEAIQKDKAAIMSLGYFSAVTVREDRGPDGVTVTYEVTENPKIASIKIVGSEPVPESKILDIMKTKPGQVLNTSTLDQDIQAIHTYYSELRYIGYVTQDIGVDPQTGVLTVPILVHKVESVEITGNKKTKSYVFLREMKTKPGTIFNFGTLEQDLRTIYGLDILELKDTNLYQIAPGTEMGQVKVVIPVTEKKTGQVSVGVGYSSEKKLVGQARLAETNFRGKGQGLNLLWEQGTGSDIAVGGNSSYELGFLEPWLDAKHTSLSVSAYNKLVYRFSSGVLTSSDDVYSERHKGGDVTVSRPLNDKLRFFVGGRFENVATDQSELLQSYQNYLAIAQDGDVTVGSLRAVHNTRDIDVDPAAGGYETASFEYGKVAAVRFNDTGGTIPFDGTFQKGSIDVRRYISSKGAKKNPNDKRTTVALRLRAGLAGGTVPYFDQFFVGGADSLRGYKEDRFWGDKMLLASVELRKPVAQSITGVLFADYGDAWGGNPAFVVPDEGLDQTQGFQGNLGVGIGLRVVTPIGNIRLDYGVGNEGGRTHFSMGQAF